MAFCIWPMAPSTYNVWNSSDGQVPTCQVWRSLQHTSILTHRHTHVLTHAIVIEQIPSAFAKELRKNKQCSPWESCKFMRQPSILAFTLLTCIINIFRLKKLIQRYLDCGRIELTVKRKHIKEDSINLSYKSFLANKIWIFEMNSYRMHMWIQVTLFLLQEQNVS